MTNQIDNEWYKPKWVFDGLNMEFDIDVCSPAGGTGIVPARKFYSIKDDGLTSAWGGGGLDESSLFKANALG